LGWLTPAAPLAFIAHASVVEPASEVDVTLERFAT
jgi:hypothetical protein